MEQSTVYLKRDRLVELENELRELKTNERKRMAEKIAEARSHGDLSENAEYDAAKEEQSHLEMKISKIENMLSRVKVINSKELPEGEVCILANVKVLDMSTKEVMNFSMVSPEEADFEQDKISIVSPIGKELLGKKIGDVVQVQVGSAKMKYKIIEIHK
jgi:transcription elongation factor GreA